MAEKIDREHVKEPREVSGWSPKEGQKSPQDFSDIAKKTEVNPEFEPNIGHETHEPLGEGAKK